VTYVELFFDLVFVFAVTQLSHHLLEHLTIAGAAETALLLGAVWMVWVYSMWATNWLDTNRAPVRLMVLALTAVGLVLSTSIPDAFGRRGLAFGIAYALMQNGRNLFLLWCIGDRDPVSRRNYTRIQFWFVVSGGLWIAGGFAGGPARIVLWAIALFLEIGSPWWRFWTPGMGQSSVSDWRVSAHHMAERCGLFMIIALGESILVTGATFDRFDWSPAVMAAFAVAVSGSIAMWWVYFATTADDAAAELASASDPGRLARGAYSYVHLPMVAGVILTAAGDELVLAHPTGHPDVATIAAIVGGPALFLAGSAMFNRMICRVWPLSHLVGLGLLLGLFWLAPVASPLALSAGTTLVLAAVGAWETMAGEIRTAHE
jgi:low temperature requirement protein LtrA